LIQPRCHEVSKKPEPEWIDEQRLEQVGEKIVVLPEVEDPPDAGAPSVRAIAGTGPRPTGGDRPAPKR